MVESGRTSASPCPLKTPYWAGEYPVHQDAVTAGERYPLPFHPLELGEEALRSPFGRPEPSDVGPFGVRLRGYRLTDPAHPEEVTRHDADLRKTTCRA
ncbi:DUF6928 family protein [Spirillospora sp. CA-294931]|uniref:DUF6928 family protein n=1 Tax=Spirillospora sp. CA-294931 TaxID=3240042 RepID=UPI003D93BD8D